MRQPMAALALLALMTGSGCEETEHADPLLEDLPENLFEDGWGETTPEQRQAVLRTELAQALADLHETPEAQRRQQAHRVALILSSLRAELMGTEEGRVEYRALEQEVELASGDEEPR